MKQVMSDIKPHLDGVLQGLVGEQVSELELVVWLLDRSEPGRVMATQFLRWMEGDVTPVTDGDARQIQYVVPTGRSLGLFVDQNQNILVPLRS